MIVFLFADAKIRRARTPGSLVDSPSVVLVCRRLDSQSRCYLPVGYRVRFDEL